MSEVPDRIVRATKPGFLMTSLTMSNHGLDPPSLVSLLDLSHSTSKLDPPKQPNTLELASIQLHQTHYVYAPSTLERYPLTTPPAPVPA